MAKTRQLAAIMFTDMVGYTALMQKDEELAYKKRERHKEVFEKAINKFNGKILQYYGDGTLSIFSSTLEGVSCAIEIQKKLSEDPKVDLRIGIHTGDIVLDDEGIYGDGVNIASRIETLAVTGGIFISEKVYDDIKNHKEILTHEIGSFELKNVTHPIRVFAIANPGFPVPSRNDIKGKTNQPTNRLAVLPFDNFSPDPENEYFSDGISEELINAFTKVDGLLVTSRTSSFAFKKKNEDVREIGKQLNVDKILEGSVRKAGNRVRITAQLINASDGYHLWSEIFDRDLTDIFEVQDEIARIITNQLREFITEKNSTQHLVKQSTTNLEAYSLLLKGKYYVAKLIPSEVKKAIGYFEEAIKLDPQFALAHALYASCYARIGTIGIISPDKAFAIVHSYADKAISLDNTLSEAYSAKGAAYLFYDWKWKEAHHYLNKALELDPGSSLASFMMSLYYLMQNEIGESVAVLEKALPYDPLSILLLDGLAEKYFMSRRYDDAIRFANKVLELDSSMRHSLETKGFCIGMKGDWNEAIKIFEEVHRLTKHPLKGLSPLAFAFAKTGQVEKAMECINKIEQRELDEPGSLVYPDLAFIWMALGNNDKAFHYLFRSVDNRMPIVPYILNSPLYTGIENDPRITELKKRMDLL